MVRIIVGTNCINGYAGQRMPSLCAAGCAGIYIYIYICIYYIYIIYMYVLCIYIYICIHIYTYVHIYTYTTHIYTYYIYKYIHICTCLCAVLNCKRMFLWRARYKLSGVFQYSKQTRTKIHEPYEQ